MVLLNSLFEAGFEVGSLRKNEVWTSMQRVFSYLVNRIMVVEGFDFAETHIIENLNLKLRKKALFC